MVANKQPPQRHLVAHNQQLGRSNSSQQSTCVVDTTVVYSVEIDTLTGTDDEMDSGTDELTFVLISALSLKCPL
jgi:hypothetical protein